MRTNTVTGVIFELLMVLPVPSAGVAEERNNWDGRDMSETDMAEEQDTQSDEYLDGMMGEHGEGPSDQEYITMKEQESEKYRLLSIQRQYEIVELESKINKQNNDSAALEEQNDQLKEQNAQLKRILDTITQEGAHWEYNRQLQQRIEAVGGARTDGL